MPRLSAVLQWFLVWKQKRQLHLEVCDKGRNPGFRSSALRSFCWCRVVYVGVLSLVQRGFTFWFLKVLRFLEQGLEVLEQPWAILISPAYSEWDAAQQEHPYVQFAVCVQSLGEKWDGQGGPEHCFSLILCSHLRISQCNVWERTVLKPALVFSGWVHTLIPKKGRVPLWEPPWSGDGDMQVTFTQRCAPTEVLF